MPREANFSSRAIGASIAFSGISVDDSAYPYCGRQSIAIRRQLSEASFNAREVIILTAAYDCAVDKLGIKGRGDPLSELIAAKIIQVYRLGEHNAQTLCQRALAELGAKPR